MGEVESWLVGERVGWNEVVGHSGGLSGGLVMMAELSSFGDRGESAVGTFSSANKLAGEAGLAEARPMLVDLGLPAEGGLRGLCSGGVSEIGSNGGDRARPDWDGPGMLIGRVLK